MPYLKNMKMVITSFCRGKAVFYSGWILGAEYFSRNPPKW